MIAILSSAPKPSISKAVWINRYRKDLMFNPLLEGLAVRLNQNSKDEVLIDCRTNRTVTVHELWCGAVETAKYFNELGVKTGDNVVVTTRIDERYCRIVYALFMIGAVPIFFDPGMPSTSLIECLKELSPKLWIADHRPPFDRFLDANQIPSHSTGHLAEPQMALREMDGNAPVLIIYTTGTTGLPKGVPWTCSNIASHLSAQNRQYGDGIKTEFVLFAHLGISAIATGRCAVLPDLDSMLPNQINIESAVSQMLKYGCDYTFASPAYWKRLTAHCAAADIKVTNAKIVCTAGASVNQQILERASSILPNSKIFVPYASTEVLMPISVISLSDLTQLTRSGTALGKGVPIGRPVDDMRVEVINPDLASKDFNERSVLTRGRVGELIVTGPRVTRNYFKRPNVELESKITDAGGSVWHRMGDMGYVDATGMIWFLSRKKHMRLLQGEIIYPDQQEQAYNYHLGIEECAVVSPSGTDSLFLVTPSNFSDLLNTNLVNEVAKLCGFDNPTLCFFPSRLPTDSRHNSKIDRESIENWLLANLNEQKINASA